MSSRPPVGSPRSNLPVPSVGQAPALVVTSFPVANGVPYAPFAQGDGATQHDAYDITVTNAGYAATQGAVTVEVDLPSGLTALAMSGSGWSCAVATETCTRGRTLSAGERSDLTLEVAVARDAPQRMQTLIQAAGGGAAPAARLDTADQDNVVSDGGEQVDPTYITRTAGG